MPMPRPIARIGSRYAEGVGNLALHSLFTMASPELLIPMVSSTGSQATLTNFKTTGQFCVSIVDRALAEAANATSAAVGPEVDEFAPAGLEAEPGPPSTRPKWPLSRRCPTASWTTPPRRTPTS